MVNIKRIFTLFTLLMYTCVVCVYAQNKSDILNYKDVIIIGEKHIDSIFCFYNPQVRDPYTKPNIRNKIWKKSLKSSSLREFLNLDFNAMFFDPRFFTSYDYFLLLPDSYEFCNTISIIEEIVFPHIDTNYKRKINILPKFLYTIDLGVKCKTLYFNNYYYSVCKPTIKSYLEVAVRVPYYNQIFHKHIECEPRCCLFCDKPFQDMLYIKLLIPLSEDTK